MSEFFRPIEAFLQRLVDRSRLTRHIQPPLSANRKIGYQEALPEVEPVEGFHDDLPEAVRNTEPIGGFLAEERSLDHCQSQLVWSGSKAAFTEQRERLQQIAQPGFAYRAVGQTEMNQILQREGIGGEGYTGLVTEEGTLFLRGGVAFSMFDGRAYGKEDDRASGGYILEISDKDVEAYSIPNREGDQSRYSVNRKIPLSMINSLYKVSILQSDSDENDSVGKQYVLSRLIPPGNLSSE